MKTNLFSHFLKSMFLMLFLIVSAFQCRDDAEIVPEMSDENKLKNLEAEISALITDKVCGTERRCGVIGFGDKPCGGPLKYLVYSLNEANEKILVDKVSTYNALQKAINIKNGFVSDCALALKPKVECVAGECKIVP